MTDIVDNPAIGSLTFQEVAMPAGDGALVRLEPQSADTQALQVPPAVRSMVAPLIAALRWCSVVLGIALTASDAADGDIGLVLTTSICLYLTTWRTMRPIQLGSLDRTQGVLSLTDTALLGAAVGVNEGIGSPFAFCVAVAAAVAAFGWGVRQGVMALAFGFAAMAISSAISDGTLGLDQTSGVIMAASMLAAVVLLGLLRARLVATEQRRAQLAGRIDALAETNQLLHVLNRVARTLPSSLDLQQAVTATRQQLTDTFDANVIGILTVSDSSGTWAPLLAEGLAIPPTVAKEGIPEHLSAALEAEGPLLVADAAGQGLAPASGSGLYTALRTRGKVVGLLAIEHPEAGRYSERDARLLGGLAEALALTIDNARWFRRLRVLGAEEERARIARDLHDRLGQWLTYISFELERISSSADSSESLELNALHSDVQRAIDELRETLRQMRTAVTESEPLDKVALELVERYANRTGITVDVQADESGGRMPLAVENELLRILQEALNNIEKHANATHVDVEWYVDETEGRFRIRDNGDGFDQAKGVRETAFGLVGMRERAEVIDAQLVVTSSPGAGTTIDVIVPRED